MNKAGKLKTTDLRQKALELMKTKPVITGFQSTNASTLKLIHELEVHQVELEMINEELTIAKELAEIATEKYTDLYDLAPLGYFTLSKKGQIIDLNLTGSQMLGKERSLLKYSQFGHYLTIDTRPVFIHFLEKVFTDETKQTCEATLLTESELPVYIYITGIVTDKTNHCLVTMIDITNRRISEQNLNEAKERAESADRLKSAFLATMSHELRTPLNSIIGFSGILMRGGPGAMSDEQRKQLGMIQSSGRHLLSLINDILDLSKIEAGQMAIEYEIFNIQDIIEDVLKLETPLGKSKGLSFDFEKSPGIGEIRCDQQHVRQVLINLVNNAVKFTEKGSVCIGCYEDQDWIKVEITDSGIGIRDEDLGHLFDPFTQIDNKLTRKQEGSGLGLSICKKIMELLHGTINVQSKYGVGSKFTITLPR